MQFIFILLLALTFENEVWGLLEGLQIKPPPAKYGFEEPPNYQGVEEGWQIRTQTRYGKRADYTNQGDIMIYETSSGRNGILNTDTRWPNATVPFYIEEDHFTDDEVKVILEAIKEYHKLTCIRFKPYEKEDKSWVIVTGNSKGCWSSIGRQGGGGQELNLMTPNCVRKGTAMHEFLHALGFYHQQSASNRDEYVKILWENILDGHEHNFDGHNESEITSYGIKYDYESIMHYGKTAFSKNDENTIEAIEDKNMELGQRKKFTDSDIAKLNKMYEDTCNTDVSLYEKAFDNALNYVDWFQTLVPSNNLSR